MKTVSAAFLCLLLAAHWTDDFEQSVARPLSLFRDDRNGTLGYVLFGLLLAAGGLMVHRLLRIQWFLDAATLLITAMLLGFVAATPSTDSNHLIVAFAILILLYVYFAVVFFRGESRWFWGHLAVPVLLVFATRLHSYGLWQKSLIVYFLLALNVEYHVVGDWLRTAGRRADKRPGLPRRETERRQKVYRLGRRE